MLALIGDKDQRKKFAFAQCKLTFKAHLHGAKVEAKGTIFFDVCHLFFDVCSLFFDLCRFRSRFPLV